MHSFANRLVEPAKILIIIGIAYSLANAGWYLISGPTPTALTDSKSSIKSGAKPTFSVADIISRNLFGQALDTGCCAGRL